MSQPSGKDTDSDLIDRLEKAQSELIYVACTLGTLSITHKNKKYSQAFTSLRTDHDIAATIKYLKSK